MRIAPAWVATDLVVLCVVLCGPARAAAQDDLPPLPGPGDDAPPAAPPPPPPGENGRPPPADPQSAPSGVVRGPAPAPAMRRNPWSPGFYLRLETGLSDVVLRGTASYPNPPTNAAGVYVSGQLGGEVAEGFAIGVYLDVDAAGANNSGGTLSLVSLGLGADWHPAQDSGWHLGAKVGYGGAAVRRDSAQSDAGGSDFACSLLGGYDWKLSPHWAVGFVGRVAYYSTVDVEFPATDGTITTVGPTGTATVATGSTPAESLRFSAVAYSLAFSALF